MSRPGLFTVQMRPLALPPPCDLAPAALHATLYGDEGAVGPARTLARQLKPPRERAAAINVGEEPLEEQPGGKLRGLLQLRRQQRQQAALASAVAAEQVTCDFFYADRDSWAAEIDAFWGSDGILAPWDSANSPASAATLLDRLEEASAERRIAALRALNKRAVGLECRNPGESCLAAAQRHSAEMVSLGLCALLLARFAAADGTEHVEDTLVQGLLFAVMEARMGSSELANALMDGAAPLSVLVLERLGRSAALPLGQRRRLLVLLRHSLLATAGTRAQRDKVRRAARSREGLFTAPEPVESPQAVRGAYTRCTIADYTAYATHMLQRFPQLVVPEPADLLRDAHPQLPAPEELAAPTSPLAALFGATAGHGREHVATFPRFSAAADLPVAVSEAIATFKRNLHIGVAQVQLARERRRFSGLCAADAPGIVDSSGDLARIGRLYAALQPTLHTAIPLLVQELYRVLFMPLGGHEQDSEKEAKNAHERNSAEDAERRVAIMAVLGSLVALLRLAKRWHACAGEYVSQLIVDSNGLVLLLKMLSQWCPPPATGRAGRSRERPAPEPPAPTTTELPAWCERDSGSGKTAWLVALETADAAAPVAKRSSFCNMYSAATALVILHKATKRHSRRIAALVAAGAPAVLKRVLAVPHSALQACVLKLFAQQMPLLPQEWRDANMRVITAAFLHLRPALCEDWLRSEADSTAVAAAAAREDALVRALVAQWHARVYGPDAFPANLASAAAEGAAGLGRRASFEGAGLLSLLRRSASGSSSLAASPPRSDMGDGAAAERAARVVADELDLLMVNLAANGGRVRASARPLVRAPQPDQLPSDFADNYETWLRHEVYERDELEQALHGDWLASDLDDDFDLTSDSSGGLVGDAASVQEALRHAESDGLPLSARWPRHGRP